jgi:hypothetical protein
MVGSPILCMRDECNLEQASLLRVVQFLRTLTAMDDGGACINDGRSVVDSLQADSLMVNRLLSMLSALGPVRSRRCASG